MWGSVAQFAGTAAVQRVHVVSATALDALLVVQILVPNEAAAADDANLAVDWWER